MIKFVFYLLLMMMISPSQAEYVFLIQQQDGSITPISSHEFYLSIDKQRMIFQFPMSLNELNQISIDQLSKEQRTLMEQDERRFLETIINKHLALTTIKVIYIPTTLYELYIIAAKEWLAMPYWPEPPFLFKTEFHSDILKSAPNDRIINELLQKANLSSARHNRVRTRFLLNQALGEMYAAGENPWSSLITKLIDQEQIFFQQKKREFKWSQLLFSHGEGTPAPHLCQSQSLKMFLHQLIKDEFQLQQEGKVSFYRGSKDFKEKPDNPSYQKSYPLGWSLSYGLTLFSGFNDSERRAPNGACAWSLTCFFDRWTKSNLFLTLFERRFEYVGTKT
jgi:hypothetical protein